MYVYLDTCVHVGTETDVAASRCYSQRSRVPSNSWCDGSRNVETRMLISAYSIFVVSTYWRKWILTNDYEDESQRRTFTSFFRLLVEQSDITNYQASHIDKRCVLLRFSTAYITRKLNRSLPSYWLSAALISHVYVWLERHDLIRGLKEHVVNQF